MEKRELICINCPLGCRLTVTMEEGTVREVTGNTCKRGKIYAEQEVTAPVRMVTTTVPVTDGSRTAVPVKTASPIPKELVLDCVRFLKDVTVTAPVRAGEPVAVYRGTEILATKDVAQ